MWPQGARTASFRCTRQTAHSEDSTGFAGRALSLAKAASRLAFAASTARFSAAESANLSPKLRSTSRQRRTKSAVSGCLPPKAFSDSRNPYSRRAPTRAAARMTPGSGAPWMRFADASVAKRSSGVASVGRATARWCAPCSVTASASTFSKATHRSKVTTPKRFRRLIDTTSVVVSNVVVSKAGRAMAHANSTRHRKTNTSSAPESSKRSARDTGAPVSRADPR